MNNSRVAFIEHQKKQILLLDFSDSNPDEVLQIIERAKSVIGLNPEGTVLTLTDVTNARFNEKVGEGMKALTAHSRPYIKAGAVVGVTGLQKVLFRTVMSFSERRFEAFDNREQAKHWLVSH